MKETGPEAMPVRFTPTALVVEDRGQGLAEAQRDRLGDRFYRPAGQAQSGSGLGLSLARAVVQSHGGEIALADSPLGGLRVTLDLPAA